MTNSLFDRIGEPIPRRVSVGLAKIGLALRSQAWKSAGRRKLTPTQGQVLAVMRAHPGDAVRLSAIADELAITRATASGAVSTLVDKGLVEKRPASDDQRAVALTLTEAGRAEAGQIMEWPDFLLPAVDAMAPAEQEVFLVGLIKMIRTLQQNGQIPVTRMCVTCDYFRPDVHDDPGTPHHCAFVDTPFGNRHLRLDCVDHQAAAPAELAAMWNTFTT